MVADGPGLDPWRGQSLDEALTPTFYLALFLSLSKNCDLKTDDGKLIVRASCKDSGFEKALYEVLLDRSLTSKPSTST